MPWLTRLLGRGRQAGTGQGSLDDQTRDHLAQAGGDLTKPTDVVNYLYLPDEALAQEAAVQLRDACNAVEVRPAAKGSTWLARANRDLVPSAANIAEMRAKFEGLAKLLGGEYDGWEAAVTR